MMPTETGASCGTWVSIWFNWWFEPPIKPTLNLTSLTTLLGGTYFHTREFKEEEEEQSAWERKKETEEKERWRGRGVQAKDGVHWHWHVTGKRVQHLICHLTLGSLGVVLPWLNREYSGIALI